jgi:hypothetical protein
MGRHIDPSSLIIAINVKTEQAPVAVMLQNCIWQVMGLNLTENAISPN